MLKVMVSYYEAEKDERVITFMTRYFTFCNTLLDTYKMDGCCLLYTSQESQFSFSTAVGLFSSVVNFIFLVTANSVSTVSYTHLDVYKRQIKDFAIIPAYIALPQATICI